MMIKGIAFAKRLVLLMAMLFFGVIAVAAPQHASGTEQLTGAQQQYNPLELATLPALVIAELAEPSAILQPCRQNLAQEFDLLLYQPYPPFRAPQQPLLSLSFSATAANLLPIYNQGP